MTPEHVTQLLQTYSKALLAKGAVARRGPTTTVLPTGMQALEHALWMCNESMHHVTEGKMEKAMRWLGFIQGVLWMTGQASIHEMKDHNREDPV